jgi:hypothetical protein
MSHLKVGDRASVLNDSIKGKIVLIDGGKAVLEDEHGFEWEYRIDQLVPHKTSSDYRLDDLSLSKDITEKIKDQLVEEGHQLKSFEIDLHIEELIEDHRNMTNHEILTKQMNVCRGFIQNAIQKGLPRVVLIHGKGEGVLKAEIHSFLNKLRHHNHVHLEYHDASFAEYGFGGATEVLFR